MSRLAPLFVSLAVVTAAGCFVDTGGGASGIREAGVDGDVDADADRPIMSEAGLCDGAMAMPESCDGSDNDCDGMIDEGFDLTSDAENCGACDNVCPAAPNASPSCTDSSCGTVCNEGFDDCDGDIANGCEVELSTDIENCGTCGMVCEGGGGGMETGDPSCAEGACALSCRSDDRADCDMDVSNGCETRINDDVMNCGMCGLVCMAPMGSSPSCSGGMCDSDCEDGLADCDGDGMCETNIATDLLNCGACRNDCADGRPNAMLACVDADCEITGCDPGFGDCDENDDNGCEVELSTASNCGSCGTTCGAGEYCNTDGAVTSCTGPADLADIAVGGGHACILGSGGRVWCWGKNNYGQAGQPAGSDVETATLVPGISDAQQLALGREHSCALVGPGDGPYRIVCWGHNQRGQLGNGSTTSSHTPTFVTGVTDATELFAGWNNTCAVRGGAALTHSLHCWGNNTDGQLGQSVTSTCGREPCATEPLAVPGLTMGAFLNRSRVGIGREHVCAVDQLSNPYCWGNNSVGQLGRGMDDIRDAIFGPAMAGGGSGVNGVALGDFHTFLITPCVRDGMSGGAYAFGYNNKGQLGIGRTPSTTVGRPICLTGLRPAAYDPLEGGYALVGSKEHSCMALAVALAPGAPAELRCWGRNNKRQLGNGASTDSYIPVSVEPTVMGRVLRISSQDDSTCVITSENHAYCWGKGDQYRLGNGSTSDRDEPTRVSGF